MEGGLVGYGATDDGGAVAVVGDGQPVEPGRPAGTEVALESDLVPAGSVGARSGSRRATARMWKRRRRVAIRTSATFIKLEWTERASHY